MATANRNTSFYLNSEALDILEKYCLVTGRSRSDVVNEFLIEFAKEHEELAKEYDAMLAKVKKQRLKKRNQKKVNN